MLTMTNPTLTLEMPEVARLSSWMATFNRDVPARVLTAISAGRGLVLLSGIGAPTAELRTSLVARLGAADIPTLRLRAPLGSLDDLREPIRAAMPHPVRSGQPLIVMIEDADRLTPGILRRLRALAALQYEGQPVLHVLLIATPAVLPLLQEAGLDAVWDDATAHIRMVADLIACLPATVTPAGPPPRPGTWLPPPGPAPTSRRRAARRAARLPWAATVTSLTLVSFAAAWSLLTPRTAPPIRTDGIVEQSVESRSLPRLPAPSAAPRLALVPLSFSPAPNVGDVPLHVTVRYAYGERRPAAEAARLVSQLRRRGLLVDDPLAVRGRARPSLSYDFAQDRDAAAALARSLQLGAPQLRSPLADGNLLARPGEISIFIGPRHRAAMQATTQTGNST